MPADSIKNMFVKIKKSTGAAQQSLCRSGFVLNVSLIMGTAIRHGISSMKEDGLEAANMWYSMLFAIGEVLYYSSY